MYGTILPAWIASDGSTAHGGAHGFICNPCQYIEVEPAAPPPNAQLEELLAFKGALQHCLDAHNVREPVPVIAVDSQYIYKILTGQAQATENQLLWNNIFAILPQFKTIPLLQHTRSHRPDTDPVHAHINAVLQDAEKRADAIKKTTSCSCHPH